MPSRSRSSHITPQRKINTPQSRISTTSQSRPKPIITPLRNTESSSPDPLDLITRFSSPDPLDLIERSPAVGSPSRYIPHTPVTATSRSIKGKKMVVKNEMEDKDELDVAREKKRRRIMLEDSTGDVRKGAVSVDDGLKGIKVEKEDDSPIHDSSTLPWDEMEDEDQRGTLAPLDQITEGSGVDMEPPIGMNTEPAAVLPPFSAAVLNPSDEINPTLPTPPASGSTETGSPDEKVVDADPRGENEEVVVSGPLTPPASSDTAKAEAPGSIFSTADHQSEIIPQDDDHGVSIVEKDEGLVVDEADVGVIGEAEDITLEVVAEPEDVLVVADETTGEQKDTRPEVRAKGNPDGNDPVLAQDPHDEIIRPPLSDIDGEAELGEEVSLEELEVMAGLAGLDPTFNGDGDQQDDPRSIPIPSSANPMPTPEFNDVLVDGSVPAEAGAASDLVFESIEDALVTLSPSLAVNSADIVPAVRESTTAHIDESVHLEAGSGSDFVLEPNVDAPVTVSISQAIHEADAVPLSKFTPVPEPVELEKVELVEHDEAEGEEEIEPELEADAQSEGQMDVASSPVIGTPQSTASGANKGKSVKAGAKAKKVGANVGKGKPKSTTAITKATGKKKTKVDALKTASQRAASVTSASTPAASSESQSHRDESVDPEDKAVYCVCGKPYAEEDEDVVMLGCDACDNWYHPACIGISEDKLELIETYICKSCERSTSQRTIYKSACKRDGCNNSVAGKSSKYCSSSCAFRYMNALLGGQTNKKIIKQLSSTFLNYPRPAGNIQIIHMKDDKHINTQKSASHPHELAALDAQIETVNTALEIIRKRQKILAKAMARCEDLRVDMGGVAEDGTKKKSAKAVDDRACGWVRGLVWSDVEVEAQIEVDDQGGVAEAEGMGETCMSLRKRCDRHGGWQKTVPVSLDVEIGQLTRRLAILRAQRQNLDVARSKQRAADSIRSDVKKLLFPRNGVSA